MVDHLVLRWALTAVFALSAALFAGAGLRAAAARQGVGVLHALAAVGMVAMIWPVGMRISPLLYVLVFTACILYFAYLAVFASVLPHPVYHCTMMAAMALMGLLMAPNAAVPVASADATGTASSGHAAHVHHAAGPAVQLQNPAWFGVVCTVLAAGFAAATLWWFYLLVRGPARPYGDLLMALGMSATFAVMAA